MNLNPRVKLSLILLVFNTIGSLIWVLGFHSIRLYLLSTTSITLLLFLFLARTPFSLSIFKFLIVLMFLIGLQNVQSGYFPILVVDLSSFGIIGSAFLIKHVTKEQLKKTFSISIYCSCNLLCIYDPH